MAASGGVRGRHGGFALVAVVAVTGLLAGLLVTMSLWARSSVETAAVTTLDAETDALLQAGVAVAGLELFVRGVPASAIDGQRLALDTGTVAISVADDGDKIDLNGSSAALLAIAWRAAGLEGLPAETFASRVLDWRDTNGRSNENGAEAEAEDYLSADLPGPRNGPFHSVSDLGWVLGVSAADVAAIWPFVTVLNPGGKLDPMRTPRSVLLLLPGIEKDVLEQVLSIRKEGPTAMARLRKLLEPQASYLEFGSPNVFKIGLEVMSNRGRHRRQARVVIIRSYDARKPYRVVAWTD